MATAATNFAPRSQLAKRAMPRRWFVPLPHTHVALDDAIEQGALFCNVLAELKAAKAG